MTVTPNSVHAPIAQTGMAGALADHGQQAIAQGSKSFALAARLFDQAMRDDVQMLYGWCRHCDDVIDGQSLGEDAPDAGLSADEQARRFEGLKRDTGFALAGEMTGQLAFDGLAHVVRKHQLPERYPRDLLAGFAMDVAGRSYQSLDETMEYCYGVAGCVGIMMAIVMGVDRDDEATLDRACDLGLAFQLTNICRDIVDDARAGRVYLPADVLQQYGISLDPQSICAQSNREKLALAADYMLDQADLYYDSATQGIRMLPPRAGAAIAAARNVYRDIGKHIRARGSHAWDDRTYTSKRRKLWLAMNGLVTGAPQSWFMSGIASRPRTDLWQRPQN